MALRWVSLACSLLLACTDPPKPIAPAPPPRPTSNVAPETPTPTSVLVPVYADDPTLGPKTAPVTIVMWSDFQCPFCSRAKPILAAIRERYGSEVRIVWKDLPLDFHKHAHEAAVVARVAYLTHGNEGFWQMHDRLFENQTQLAPENLRAYAADLGIDASTIESYRTQAEAAVERGLAESKQLGIQGTPNFLIDGQLITGAQKVERFSEIIDAHLAKAKELAAQGTPPHEIYPALVQAYWKVAPPEVVVDEPIDTTVWEVQVGSAPTKGPKDAPVTIVTFSEFQCPFCKRMEPTLAQLEKDYPGKLRFVWKDNPLAFHARALPAANAAREVRKQKGDAAFWSFHDALFSSQPKLEDSDLESLAGAIPGIDTKKVMAAILKDRWRSDIDKDLEQGELLDVSGTPHSFINGRVLNGAQQLPKWKKLIDEELAKAEAKIKAGTPADKVYEVTIKGGKSKGPVDLKVPADAPFRGGAKAKVVLQVFSEFQCPFCRRFARPVPGSDGTGTLEKLQMKYGDKIKIVWRDFPLAFHPRARVAAAFAREAKKQKGMVVFWKVHDDLFDLAGALDDEKLEELAKRYGMDWAKAKAAIASGAHDAAIDADQKEGGAAGVSGTPATFVNGKAVVGAQPEDAFIKLIDRALSKTAK